MIKYLYITLLLLIACRSKIQHNGEWVKAAYNNKVNQAAYDEYIKIENDKIELSWYDYGINGREKKIKKYEIDSVITDIGERKYFIYIVKTDKNKYLPVNFVELPDGSIRAEGVVYKSNDGFDKNELNRLLSDAKAYKDLASMVASGPLFTERKAFERYATFPIMQNVSVNFYSDWSDSVINYIEKYPDSVKINMYVNSWDVARKVFINNHINPYEAIYRFAVIEDKGMPRNGDYDSIIVATIDSIDNKLMKVYFPEIVNPYMRRNSFELYERCMGINR